MKLTATDNDRRGLADAIESLAEALPGESDVASLALQLRAKLPELRHKSHTPSPEPERPGSAPPIVIPVPAPAPSSPPVRWRFVVNRDDTGLLVSVDAFPLLQ